ncbi:MAG: peptidoglycan DD-metalloendopeptidase family protein [Thauera phenolivorans]|uniref:Peptidoglycan DD-metalloendopeptidase family protein n=1 Tax=Thauera phenolivorans TaxID=1792543 RepID=A0A7X7R899_9RHOO|nr:peptidoglycan DD-metalloendopeptidase family protein [Thauera phenolivorans]NLF54985.1 peptidoglycan DD-metalloendopeptidase family protein [Thauera phenolivorans]
MQSRKLSILADLPVRLLPRRRSLLLAGIAAGSMLGVVAATAVAPGGPGAAIALDAVVERLALPAAEALGDNSLPFAHDVRVQPGDTLPAIFDRMGIDDADALAFISSSETGRAAVRELRSGRSVTGLVEADGSVSMLSLPLADNERLRIERGDNGKLRVVPPEAARLTKMIEMRTGTIRQSLHRAADEASLPDEVTKKLVELFGTVIDFHADLHGGDRFSVVYERLYDAEGLAVRVGRVLAAEFINRGKKHLVVLHQQDDGRDEYYTAEGRSLRQGFLRSPMEFSRISSGFGRRLHPIHKSWRAHNGVDYAAPVGTPVRAVSDGVVEFAGRQGGFGNLLVLRHQGKYETAYAHLNGFAPAVKAGAKVSQGEIVAFVGSTGWSTGPHLHYEIRIDGVPHNPAEIDLPEATPLTGAELELFRRNAEPLLHRIAMMSRTATQVANRD